MNKRLIAYYLSTVCTFLAVAMGSCFLFAFPSLGHRTADDWHSLSFETDGFLGLLLSVIVSVAIGLTLKRYAGDDVKSETLRRKEAMAVVGLSWVIATILGALPFWISGVRYAAPIRIDSRDHIEVFDMSIAPRQQWKALGQPITTGQFDVLTALLEDDLPSQGMTFADLNRVTGRDDCINIVKSLNAVAAFNSWLVVPSESSETVRLKWLKMEFANSIFESQSGFSTTGATVINKLEDPGLVPYCILYWRSMTHFLGGLGIIVLFVVLLGGDSAGKMLMKAEMPGPSKDGATPKMQNTARRFGIFYLVLNVVLTVCLMFAGMNLFDAICHAFGTMATGGFSTYDTSVGHFDSATIDYIITLFMIAAGTNFALFYTLVVLDKSGKEFWVWIKGKLTSIFSDIEFRVYLGVIVLSTIAIMASGMVAGDWDLPADAAAEDSIVAALLRSIRYGLFQVVAIVTTTGFGTHDFDSWSQFGRCLMFALMFIGGCAGSTGGGMKVIRHVLFVKILGQEVEHVYHPSVVRPLRLGGVVYDNQEMRRSILVYFGLVAMIFMASWIAIVALEPNSTWPIDQTENKLIDSASAVAATLNNIGPGLGIVGATNNYSDYSPASKLIFTWLMMLGRLELFSILVLFSWSFWKRPR
jgi:trk system potassium uptake protein